MYVRDLIFALQHIKNQDSPVFVYHNNEIQKIVMIDILSDRVDLNLSYSDHMQKLQSNEGKENKK